MNQSSKGRRTWLAALGAAVVLGVGFFVSAPAALAAHAGDTPIQKINGLIDIISQTDISPSVRDHLVSDLKSARHILHGSPHHYLNACFPLADAEFVISINTGYVMPPLINPWIADQWLDGIDEAAFEIGCFVL